MEYGLIGKKLGHSFSKEIHEKIGKYNYQLIELDENQFVEFMNNKNFKAINVTIPYKEKVMEYLDYISDEALKIKAVNTIVNKDGKLYGYNTDYLGLKEMINHFNIDINNKNIMILGNGGTCKTATAVLNDLNAKSIIKVSLNNEIDTISYEDIHLYSNSIDVLVNTTPKEMFPNNQASIITLDGFNNLKSVVDVVYNPLRTNLVVRALNNNLKATGGLYMLIAQAFYAIEIFLDEKLDNNIINSIYNEMINKKENIVLIGMPSCGKSTVGKKLAQYLNKKFIDVDDKIIEKINMDIASYFKKYGETSFREIESQVIEEISKENSIVISTGGGSILKENNVRYLKQNGKLFFLDRDVENLLTSDDRPLSSSLNDLLKRYEERYPIYNKVCDVKINGNLSVDKVINEIVGVK